MGTINLTLAGSFGAHRLMSFSAMVGGHAKAVADAIKYLAEVELPAAIKNDHECQRDGIEPTLGFGSLGKLDGLPIPLSRNFDLTKGAGDDVTQTGAVARIDPGSEETYQAAVAVVHRLQRVSISLVQRELRIGYNAAARHVERMAAEGIAGHPDKSGVRCYVHPRKHSEG